MLSERVKEWTKDWKQQGIEEGLQKGEAQLLLRQLELRFGREAADRYRERIQAADAETLLLWSERILTANSAEEVVARD